MGSVRHYFASSDELLTFSFAAVIDRISGRLESALLAVEDEAPGSPEQHSAVLNLLGQFLPLDEELAVDACVWMAFRHAARINPVLAAEAERSHRAVAAIVGRLIVLLSPGEAEVRQSLVTEAERLLATMDGLCMHALLQPEWMTAEMCSDVLTAHLAAFEPMQAAR